MEFLKTLGWLEICLRLGSAALVGAMLGLNRELRGKPAGLRTNALVSLGSALLVMAGIGLSSGMDGKTNVDAISRIIQGIITGIGFLGAGVIIRDAAGTSVHGLTTSALVWLVAALGILCGIGAWPPALLGTGITLLIIVIGRPLERIIHNRFPALTENNHDNRDQHR